MEALDTPKRSFDHVNHLNRNRGTDSTSPSRDIQLREPHLPTPTAEGSTLQPTFGRVRAIPLSAMLSLSMIQDSAERTITLHRRITLKEYLEDSWGPGSEQLGG